MFLQVKDLAELTFLGLLKFFSIPLLLLLKDTFSKVITYVIKQKPACIENLPFWWQ